MPLLKWLKKTVKKISPRNTTEDLDLDDDDRRQAEEETTTSHDGEEVTHDDEIKLVYFASATPKQHLIDILSVSYKDTQPFIDEIKCVEYVKSTISKVFLIIDGTPSTTLIEAIEPLNQIDSVFVYSPSSNDFTRVNEKQHSYILNWCENEAALHDSINKSREEFHKQADAFRMFNKEEKAACDLSKEQGSFVFFQIFKLLLKNMPNTYEAKKTMIKVCRNYYRGNLTELKNIDDFDQTYKSVDAIPWFTKETFLYKFIYKTLRTQDIYLIYQLRFYIKDFSEQLELKFKELKEKQKDVLKLYRATKLSSDDVANFQNSIGNLISCSGYLSTSSEYSVAYGFGTKSPKREGFEGALFEYIVDLDVVQNIVLADVREYSAFPEEAEVIVDIGATFQIDSCEYNTADELWHIKLHATDQGADLGAEYIEYQKQKMIKSNPTLIFGDLLLEMGEYAKAERHFDTVLNSSNLNDKDIACIFFNFGRIHRLKGDFNRAINCYKRSYDLCMNARLKRFSYAGKAVNGLGIVYSELGQQMKAEEYFQQAMKLYKKSIRKKHVEIAGTLINLGTIDCDRQNFTQALNKYQEAKKIYDSSLPLDHPNRALQRVNEGNIHLATGNYEIALQEYELALKLQEALLPADHANIARTLHNLAIVHASRGNMDEATKYLERAKEIAGQTLSLKHSVMTLLDKPKDFLID
ncbi:unnamed protein product [Rotaria sp. Silwood1]|nr:unnamed protein product [Rotaria sp. Silwood1]CAF1599451.1 unnamed protein product [Rotaria sp. Silwood1]CAF3659040.1 unnamed protein product [Rotaria sp. Silwood1]CAF4754186.1 unnamed protein product [Rotaria sp. Silwood1]CAF4941563.1 unnamed protein product [Rotaria sp. Silwood1]